MDHVWQYNYKRHCIYIGINTICPYFVYLVLLERWFGESVIYSMFLPCSMFFSMSSMNAHRSCNMTPLYWYCSCMTMMMILCHDSMFCRVLCFILWVLWVPIAVVIWHLPLIGSFDIVVIWYEDSMLRFYVFAMFYKFYECLTQLSY